MDSVAVPVAAGLAAGITFVALFSLFSIPQGSWTLLNKNEFIAIEIKGLKDTYRLNEPISFSIYVKGASRGLCNNPQATAVIVSLATGKPVWSTPLPTFQTAMLCNVQEIDREWRFGYEGEELPYQSALTYDEKKYDNLIAVDKAGQYRLIASFDGQTAEKEFFGVIGATSGKTITTAQAPDGAIQLQIEDKD
ncbi:MAG: hypothetical protein ABI347_11505 [Nitrososphaera sp.]